MRSLEQSLLSAWAHRLSGWDGTFSLSMRGADGVIAAAHADQPHYAASTMKLAVLAAVLTHLWDAPAIPVTDQFEGRLGGRFRLAHSDDQDDQTWNRLGTAVPVAELAERMIVASSNIATNLLLSEVGFDAVAEFLLAAGLNESIKVGRLIGDDAAEQAGCTNTVTAAGLSRLLQGVADGAWLPAERSAAAIEILHRQTYLDQIPAGLPSGTWSANKSGWVPGVTHDVALVRPAAAPAYVLAVCTTADLDDQTVNSLIADLSRISWDHWTRHHS